MTRLRYVLDRVAEALEWHAYTLCRIRPCPACDRIRRRDDRILGREIREPITDESGAFLDMKDFVPEARARYRSGNRGSGHHGRE
jgi:hypothetical protein